MGSCLLHSCPGEIICGNHTSKQGVRCVSTTSVCPLNFIKVNRTDYKVESTEAAHMIHCCSQITDQDSINQLANTFVHMAIDISPLQAGCKKSVLEQHCHLLTHAQQYMAESGVWISREVRNFVNIFGASSANLWLSSSTDCTTLDRKNVISS